MESTRVSRCDNEDADDVVFNTNVNSMDVLAIALSNSFGIQLAQDKLYAVVLFAS